MNTINSIYIPFVEQGVTSEYIMDVFASNEIATVSRITLIPYVSRSKYSEERYSQAFIDIDTWHETEVAYNFIQSLRDFSKETRFTYSSTNWWTVEINPKPWITCMELFKEDTTTNELLYAEIYQIICDIIPSFQRTTNDLGAKLLEHIQKKRDFSDWKDIELSLFEEKQYQQMEHELCL